MVYSPLGQAVQRPGLCNASAHQLVKLCCFIVFLLPHPQDQILHLMRDIFSLTTVRYSSVEDLSDDIMDSTNMIFQQLVEHFQASVASR